MPRVPQLNRLLCCVRDRLATGQINSAFILPNQRLLVDARQPLWSAFSGRGMVYPRFGLGGSVSLRSTIRRGGGGLGGRHSGDNWHTACTVTLYCGGRQRGRIRYCLHRLIGRPERFRFPQHYRSGVCGCLLAPPILTIQFNTPYRPLRAATLNPRSALRAASLL